MRSDFRLSGRSWLLIALLLAALAALLAPRPDLDALARSDDAHLGRRPPPDRALPGGATAALSGCGDRGQARPAPRGRGEREPLPALVAGGHGYTDPGPRGKGRARFTLDLGLNPGGSPLHLPLSAAEHGFTVDVWAPHGAGRLASARGLSAMVLKGVRGKPVPPTEGLTFTGNGDLRLRIELPRAAVCPGHDFGTLMRSVPESSNDTRDYPVFVVTLTDPAVRTHRARLLGLPPRAVSDRLVWVSWEEETGEAA